MSSMKLNPRKFRQCMKIELVGVENQTQISSTYKQLWEDWKLFKNSRMFCLFVCFFLSLWSKNLWPIKLEIFLEKEMSIIGIQNITDRTNCVLQNKKSSGEMWQIFELSNKPSFWAFVFHINLTLSKKPNPPI